jgi:hypothetical protein
LSLLSSAQDRQFERVVDAGYLELFEARGVKEVFPQRKTPGKVQPAAMRCGAWHRGLKVPPSEFRVFGFRTLKLDALTMGGMLVLGTAAMRFYSPHRVESRLEITILSQSAF